MQKTTILVIFAVVFFASAFFASANQNAEEIGAKILKNVRGREWSTFDPKEPKDTAAKILYRASNRNWDNFEKSNSEKKK
uniref:Salivary secreted protein n=1 Tax=Mayetiola destructor TaxID=39758 RepID=Q6W011_MAYDE|nr:salivary secreted protein [Mayetiola destructor]